MLTAWETVWVCVMLTAGVIGIDWYFGQRLAKKADQSRLASKANRANRQRSMVFNDLENRP